MEDIVAKVNEALVDMVLDGLETKGLVLTIPPQHFREFFAEVKPGQPIRTKFAGGHPVWKSEIGDVQIKTDPKMQPEHFMIEGISY